MNDKERLLLQLGKASVMAHSYLVGNARNTVELTIAEACNHLWQAYIKNDPGREQYSREACDRIDMYLGKQWRDIDTQVGGKLESAPTPPPSPDPTR